MYSIGLDISKSTINVYVPLNDFDLVIDNNLKSLKNLYSKLKKYYKKEFGNLVFVFEPTGNYSSVIKKFAANNNIKCFIVNPKQSSNFSKAIGQRNKNDVNDARMLSQMIVTASQEQIKVPVIKENIEEIKELITYYQFLIKQKSQNKNHLESLVAKDGQSKLIQRIKKEIKLLEQKEKEIIFEIKKVIARDDKLQEAFFNVQSIKGVGEVSAIVLLHHFIQYADANQKEIISLAGLDPIEKNSGISVKGKTRISKAGSKLCRSVLFMATLSAIQHNKELKRFYNRLKDNGKHTTVAQIAVMRKIVVIAHSIYKNNEIYEEERFKRYL